MDEYCARRRGIERTSASEEEERKKKKKEVVVVVVVVVVVFVVVVQSWIMIRAFILSPNELHMYVILFSM